MSRIVWTKVRVRLLPPLVRVTVIVALPDLPEAGVKLSRQAEVTEIGPRREGSS